MKVEIRYHKMFPEWHPQSRPYVVDIATGETIAEIPQFVDHPGKFDERANFIAMTIAVAINLQHNEQEKLV